MDVVWWLMLAIAAVWQLRRVIRGLRTASRRIDADIAAFNREHPRIELPDASVRLVPRR
ncbi:hypothetical protein ABIA65_001655 [Mycolicibacterium sp. 624]|jgi:hypothetical protein